MSQPYFVCAISKDFALPEFSQMVEEANNENIGIKTAADMNQLFLHVENPECFGVVFVEGFAIDMISAIQQMKFATDAKCVFVTRGKENAKMLGLKAQDAGAIAVIHPPVHRVTLLNRARQLQKERPKIAEKVEQDEEVKPQFRGIRYIFPKGDYRPQKPTWEKEAFAFRKRVEKANLKLFEAEFHKLLAFLKGVDERSRISLFSFCPRALSEGVPSQHIRRLCGSEDAVRGLVIALSSRMDIEAAIVEGKSIVIPNMDLFRKENKFPVEKDDPFRSRITLLISNSAGQMAGCLSIEYSGAVKGADLELAENILCYMRGMTENFEEFDYLSRAYFGV